MKRGDGATRKKRKLLSMLAYDPCMSGWVAGWLGGWAGLSSALRSRDNKRRKFKAKLIF